MYKNDYWFQISTKEQYDLVAWLKGSITQSDHPIIPYILLQSMIDRKAEKKFCLRVGLLVWPLVGWPITLESKIVQRRIMMHFGRVEKGDLGRGWGMCAPGHQPRTILWPCITCNQSTASRTSIHWNFSPNSCKKPNSGLQNCGQIIDWRYQETDLPIGSTYCCSDGDEPLHLQTESLFIS